MEIQFLGAARTVTGSMHRLQVNGETILLDCGLFQGRRKEAFERNRNLPFNAADVGCLILSHAHIDHSGNVPNLVKSGFEGNMWSTFATRDLCSIMLLDSGYIHEKDALYVNKRHARKGEPPVEPLYTVDDASRSLKYFVSIGYDRWFRPSPGVRSMFFDAGHILGSAITLLEIDDRGRQLRLAFSGDLGRRDMPILRDPTFVNDIDALIIESTYGDRRHETIQGAEAVLERVVNDTCGRGGKVIIPSFAVGRTQELVYALHRLTDAHRVPEVPIFVDSPLAVNATEIFRLHPECFDEETNAFMEDDKHPGPFGFGRLRYIRDVEESKRLNTMEGPAIIISASGMAETGRILHHLKNHIGNPANTVLIVGWQAPHTLGRRLVEKCEVVRIFGEEYQRLADVQVINGFSAHADRPELLDFVARARTNGRLQHVFVVHGDEEPAMALAEGIKALGVPHVRVPERGETVAI